LPVTHLKRSQAPSHDTNLQLTRFSKSSDNKPPVRSIGHVVTKNPSDEKSGGANNPSDENAGYGIEAMSFPRIFSTVAFPWPYRGLYSNDWNGGNVISERVFKRLLRGLIKVCLRATDFTDIKTLQRCERRSTFRVSGTNIRAMRWDSLCRQSTDTDPRRPRGFAFLIVKSVTYAV
jgi:hypothetical protein